MLRAIKIMIISFFLSVRIIRISSTILQILMYLIHGSANFLALGGVHRLLPEREVVEGELGHRRGHWNDREGQDKPGFSNSDRLRWRLKLNCFKTSMSELQIFANFWRKFQQNGFCEMKNNVMLLPGLKSNFSCLLSLPLTRNSWVCATCYSHYFVHKPL